MLDMRMPMKGSDEPAQSVELQPGIRVMIQGSSNPAMNGRKGTIIKYENKRWLVELEATDTLKAMRVQISKTHQLRPLEKVDVKALEKDVWGLRQHSDNDVEGDHIDVLASVVPKVAPAGPPPDSDLSPQQLAEKVKEIRDNRAKWKELGGDPEPVGETLSVALVDAMGPEDIEWWLLELNEEAENMHYDTKIFAAWPLKIKSDLLKQSCRRCDLDEEIAEERGYNSDVLARTMPYSDGATSAQDEAAEFERVFIADAFKRPPTDPPLHMPLASDGPLPGSGKAWDRRTAAAMNTDIQRVATEMESRGQYSSGSWENAFRRP